MAKFIVCTAMIPGAAGAQELVKEVTAHDVVVRGDGSLVFTNHAGEFVASFKQYIWCLDELSMPVVVAPVRSLRQ